MPPKKDKDKPKGKTSAYAYFVQEMKEGNKKKGISLDFATFSQTCAADWKKITDKSKFNKLAELDKQRWEREMKDYVPPPDSKDGKRKKKRQKDVNAPKRGMSAFMFFSQEKRPNIKKQNPNASVGEIAKQLGSLWKLMTPDQKVPYEEMAKNDRERYLEEMAEYRKTDGGASAGKKSPQKRGRKPKKAAVVEEVEDDDEEEEEEEEEEESSSD